MSALDGNGGATLTVVRMTAPSRFQVLLGGRGTHTKSLVGTSVLVQSKVILVMEVGDSGCPGSSAAMPVRT